MMNKHALSVGIPQDWPLSGGNPDFTDYQAPPNCTDLVLFGSRIPFCAADALWGGVTHTFGQISEHGAVFLGLGELTGRRVWNPGP